MKRFKLVFAILFIVTVLLSFASCGNKAASENKNEAAQSSTDIIDQTQTKPSVTEENGNMLNIEIVVGNKTFSATLYDNEAARALSQQLPMTIDMSELNGNEKYSYLDSSLPTDPKRPSKITAGDIMLYGNNCIVLFYESFSTAYSYTPLGHIDDPQGLASALGGGSVEVTFQK